MGEFGVYFAAGIESAGNAMAWTLYGLPLHIIPSHYQSLSFYSCRHSVDVILDLVFCRSYLAYTHRPSHSLFLVSKTNIPVEHIPLVHRYLISQHPGVEARIVAELEEVGLLASAEQPQPRDFQRADLAKLTYFGYVCKATSSF